MWKELVLELCPDAEFAEPVSAYRIDESAAPLGTPIPDDLRSVLRESNGILGSYGLGLVWSLERILADNQRYRTSSSFADLYMPFDHLLFFADAGNGDQFAYARRADGRVHRPDIFVWNHENDSRTWCAPSLRGYLEAWLSGRLTL